MITLLDWTVWTLASHQTQQGDGGIGVLGAVALLGGIATAGWLLMSPLRWAATLAVAVAVWVVGAGIAIAL